MPSNTLHHDRTLSKLNTEVKYCRGDRRWSRYGRNGETTGSYAKTAVKAYNKAARKASKRQLSRYQPPEVDYHEDYRRDIDWDDLIKFLRRRSYCTPEYYE